MKPIVRIPLKYGAIAGLLGGALLIGLYYIGFHPMLIPPFFDFRIFLFGVFLFFALKELRDVHQSGVMYFGQGMMCSFLLVTIYSIIAGGIIGVFGAMVPEFVTSFVKIFKEQLSSWPKEDIERVGKETFERNLSELSSTNNMLLAWNYFKQSYWIGMFISIILSVSLRSQPKT